MVLVKYYSWKLAKTPLKHHKSDTNWPLFGNKQQFWWSASITLDNNNAVWIDFYHVFILHTLLHASVGQSDCISIIISVLNLLTTLLPFGSLEHNYEY